MTKISALTPLGDGLAVGDQFIIRDIDDTGTPNKSVTISGITRGLEVGTALAPSIAFAADKNTGIYGTGSDVLALVTAGENRLHITAGGLVGIGTSSPGAFLSVEGNSATSAIGFAGRFYDTATNRGFGSPLLYVRTPNDTASSSAIGMFGVGDNADTSELGNLFRITQTGQVGIGTATPTNTDKLEIQTSSTSAPGLWVQTGGTTSAYPIADFRTGSNLSALLIRGDGASVFTGRVLVGTSTARTDYFNNGLTAMLQVEGTNYGGNVDRACVSIVNNNSVTVNEAPVLILGRSNGSALNSKTIVSDGTRCGYISFQGADGSDLIDAASIAGEIDGTPGANDMPGRLVFSTTADGGSSPTERMRINQDGSTLWRSNGATATHDIGNLSTSATGYISLISSYRNTTNNTYSFLACVRQGFAVALEIRDSGNIYNTNGVYGAFSDIKLKENVVDATSQWSDIKAVKVRKYNFKEETNHPTHTQIGLVAQEVELVSPGLVTECPDRDEEGNDLGTVTKSVNYSVLYMKAVKALQEAMERIETLEQRLTAAGID